jgi:hypothetical protein
VRVGAAFGRAAFHASDEDFSFDEKSDAFPLAAVSRHCRGFYGSAAPLNYVPGNSWPAVKASIPTRLRGHLANRRLEARF